tara:strand:+ start:786 stop:1028 length:243 start_codon:yes stop_codon:yes gene_type:complete
MPGNIFHFVYSEGASKKVKDTETNLDKVDELIELNNVDKRVDFFDYHYHWKNRYEVEKIDSLLSKMIKFLHDETFMDIIN